MQDEGSRPRLAKVLVQPLALWILSGADITMIIGGDLFKKVAVAAKFKTKLQEG